MAACALATGRTPVWSWALPGSPVPQPPAGVLAHRVVVSRGCGDCASSPGLRSGSLTPPPLPPLPPVLLLWVTLGKASKPEAPRRRRSSNGGRHGSPLESGRPHRAGYDRWAGCAVMRLALNHRRHVPWTAPDLFFHARSPVHLAPYACPWRCTLSSGRRKARFRLCGIIC